MTPDQTQLVVVDLGKQQLDVWDAIHARPVATLRPSAARALVDPFGVAFVPHTGQLLVSDQFHHHVVLLGGLTDTAVVRVFGDGKGSGERQLHNPCGVAVIPAFDVQQAADPAAAAAAAAGLDATLVAIVDAKNHRIVLYRLADAAFVRSIGSEGFELDQFMSPCAIAVVPSACIPTGGCWLAVTDQQNLCVKVLTLTGQVVRMLEGSATNGLAELSSILNGITVCLDATGDFEVLVVDAWNHRVVAFRLDGSAARVVCDGSGVRSSRPADQRGRMTGMWQSVAKTGRFDIPGGLAVTASGDLWVTDSRHHCLTLFR